MIRHVSRLGILTLGVFSAFLLTACGGGARTIEVKCDDFQQTSTVTREIEITIDETFEILLCSNPSTGFSWNSPLISDASLVGQVNHEFLAPQEDKPGAPGKDKWSFRGTSKGNSEISIEYVRLGASGVSAEWSFTISVTVVDHGFI